MALSFGPRRAIYAEIGQTPGPGETRVSPQDLAPLEAFDLTYRSLCALLYNYVPTSGHPGGSISSGHFVAGILFDALDYDLSQPDRADADIISYAAGHKAMGLYALWALRDEIARVAAPELLPTDIRDRLRLEDLLGFRRNPITSTPLFKEFNSKPLDGHPTPATPFVKLSTGASGVGVASSIGLAFGARDRFGADAPRVHIVEGEGGLTPGRVAEALAAAGTASLGNVVVHVDWNQASIDSNRVCRDGADPGDYVQWTPAELFYLNDWNVIAVDDGLDFAQVLAAQRAAREITNGQPTAIIYRTIKGWKYGIEGKASHGAGHKLCSGEFYGVLNELTASTAPLPACDAENRPCDAAGKGEAIREECLWKALSLIRQHVQDSGENTSKLAARLVAARDRLNERGRAPRAAAPNVAAAYEFAAANKAKTPEQLALTAGSSTTLRGELGRALQLLNKTSDGAFLVASADLLGSTSVNTIAADFADGFWNADTNPDARLLSIGGICEDAATGILAGLTTFGSNIGVASSYGAFLAPLSHIAARLHAIGSQARQSVSGEAYKPIILVCAHAGLKTGEDGPTHADPQALQLFQENFPTGTSLALTPWEPQEIWPLLAEAFTKRPAVIAPFVTRPNETVLDRTALGLADPTAAATGIYALRRPSKGDGDVTIVIQESAVAYAFVEEALPLLLADGIDPLVYYVACAELFDLLPAEEQELVFPAEHAQLAMGITGFTLPTMQRWVRSQRGLDATLHPYRKGHFLGSGQGEKVLREAGLDGESQYQAIKAYMAAR